MWGEDYGVELQLFWWHFELVEVTLSTSWKMFVVLTELSKCLVRGFEEIFMFFTFSWSFYFIFHTPYTRRPAYGTLWSLTSKNLTHNFQFLIWNLALFPSTTTQVWERVDFSRNFMMRIFKDSNRSKPFKSLQQTHNVNLKRALEMSETRLELCWLRSFAKSTARVKFVGFCTFWFSSTSRLRLSRSLILRADIWLMICELFQSWKI